MKVLDALPNATFVHVANGLSISHLCLELHALTAVHAFHGAPGFDVPENGTAGLPLRKGFGTHSRCIGTDLAEPDNSGNFPQ
jgi:hypothetical protein